MLFQNSLKRMNSLNAETVSRRMYTFRGFSWKKLEFTRKSMNLLNVESVCFWLNMLWDQLKRNQLTESTLIERNEPRTNGIKWNGKKHEAEKGLNPPTGNYLTVEDSWGKSSIYIKYCTLYQHFPPSRLVCMCCCVVLSLGQSEFVWCSSLGRSESVPSLCACVVAWCRVWVGLSLCGVWVWVGLCVIEESRLDWIGDSWSKHLQWI